MPNKPKEILKLGEVEQLLSHLIIEKRIRQQTKLMVAMGYRPEVPAWAHLFVAQALFNLSAITNHKQFDGVWNLGFHKKKENAPFLWCKEHFHAGECGWKSMILSCHCTLFLCIGGEKSRFSYLKIINFHEND